MGTQGICAASKDMKQNNILVARSIVTLNEDCTVPVKLLNPTNEAIVLGGNTVLADFNMKDEPFDVISTNRSGILDCCQLRHTDNSGKSLTDSSQEQADHLARASHPPDFAPFISNFTLSGSELNDAQEQQLAECLHANWDSFVSEQNPDLGTTHLVEHQIHLKPDATLRHQRPSSLSFRRNWRATCICDGLLFCRSSSSD